MWISVSETLECVLHICREERALLFILAYESSNNNKNTSQQESNAKIVISSRMYCAREVDPYIPLCGNTFCLAPLVLAINFLFCFCSVCVFCFGSVFCFVASHCCCLHLCSSSFNIRLLVRIEIKWCVLAIWNGHVPIKWRERDDVEELSLNGN